MEDYCPLGQINSIKQTHESVRWGVRPSDDFLFVVAVFPVTASSLLRHTLLTIEL